LSISSQFAIIKTNLIKFITVDLVMKLTVFQICLLVVEVSSSKTTMLEA